MACRYPNALKICKRITSDMARVVGHFKPVNGGRCEFQARVDDFFVVFFTPFTPRRRPFEWKIPCRLQLYGFRIIDREGICLDVVWVKDRERVLKFRRPKRFAWVRRLRDAWEVQKRRARRQTEG
jgi:hypothetical protein